MTKKSFWRRGEDDAQKVSALKDQARRCALAEAVEAGRVAKAHEL